MSESETRAGPFLQDVLEAKFNGVPIESLFPGKQEPFIPTLESVRAYYGRQRIPDILEVGPEATPGGYRFVVERDTPDWCKKEVDKMYSAAVGTPWNNLMLAVDENSITLRYQWEKTEDQKVELANPQTDPVTLEDARAYFATDGRGMGIGSEDIITVGAPTSPGVYPVMLRNMEDWHAANVRKRIPDLPDGYNNELMVSSGVMAIRFTC